MWDGILFMYAFVRLFIHYTKTNIQRFLSVKQMLHCCPSSSAMNLSLLHVCMCMSVCVWSWLVCGYTFTWVYICLGAILSCSPPMYWDR